MANEIRVTTGLSVTNGELNVNVQAETKTFDQTLAGGGGPGTVVVATSEGTISFGQITPGWVHIKNIDSTNYVRFGFSTGVYGFRVEPGGVAQFRMESGATLYGIADTASCRVKITALDI